MAKVRYLRDDGPIKAGHVDYLDYHSMQAALNVTPPMIEVINDEQQAATGTSEDKKEFAGTQSDPGQIDATKTQEQRSADEPDYEGMTKAELIDIAKERHINLPSSEPKAAFVEALQASDSRAGPV